MDLQLKGKTAIVTGGTAGIGLAVARFLAEEGVEVTIPGRNGKKLNEAISLLPGVVRGVQADLGSAEGAALHRCLDLLDTERRRLVVMAFVDGLSHSELAERLRLPLRQAKEFLQRKLQIPPAWPVLATEKLSWRRRPRAGRER